MSTFPDDWLPLEKPWITPEGRWESRVRFDFSSEWFSGHFDECPLMPGVALLALAAETVKRQACENGRFLEVSGFFRVKFKRFVFPDEELQISVAAMPPGPEAKLDFHITCCGESVVQGVLIVGEEVSRGGRNDATTPPRTQEKDRGRTPAQRCVPG